ncbi:hypothetical protein, partial [Phocaeicola abscessus]
PLLFLYSSSTFPLLFLYSSSTFPLLFLYFSSTLPLLFSLLYFFSFFSLCCSCFCGLGLG